MRDDFHITMGGKRIKSSRHTSDVRTSSLLHTEIKILCSEKVGDRKFKGSCFASKNDKGDEMGNTEDLVVFRKLKKSSNQSA